MSSDSPAAGGSKPPTNRPAPSGNREPRVAQKNMTKAERREMQEKQRAAKAATKSLGSTSQPGQNQASSSTPAKPRPAKLEQPQAAAPPSPSVKRPSHGHRLSIGGPRTPAMFQDATPRRLRIFSHFGQTKTSHSVKGDVHPAIIRLGLLFSEFKITGANARCIATLTAFKTVIQDYVTPPDQTLSRHLVAHLSPQISHLVSARPMPTTMGNAIRHLKLEISSLDIDLPEQDAKRLICQKIDNYIRDRIIIADEVIQETTVKKIKDGDNVLVYARSSVVEKVLIAAHDEGTHFTVTVVDSRPLLEGKRLLSVLSSKEIPCTYLLLPALASIITEISIVLVGAHSLHSNGAVTSRAGTALVAMMASQHSVPVMVCCETYKFAEGVQLDGFTKNELAPTGDMFSTSFPLNRPTESLVFEGQADLEVFNPLYDLTPPTSITAVVTEVGIIPPSSISSIPLALGKQAL